MTAAAGEAAAGAAAESIAAAIAGGAEHSELMDYDDAVRSSWIAEELKKVKNAQPALNLDGEVHSILARSCNFLLPPSTFGPPLETVALCV